jgi:hypothetical protein
LLFDEVVEAHQVVINTVQVGSHLRKQLAQCVSRSSEIFRIGFKKG